MESRRFTQLFHNSLQHNNLNFEYTIFENEHMLTIGTSNARLVHQIPHKSWKIRNLCYAKDDNIKETKLMEQIRGFA